MRKFVLLFSLVFAFTVPSYAQDAPASSACPEAADVLPVIAEFLTELADEPMTALDVIYEAVVEARAKCAGLVFSSDEYGLQPVIGPVDIPEGLYRATFTGETYAIIDITQITGECGEGVRMYQSSFISATPDVATNGAQGVVGSAGCTALFEVSMADKPWTLTFEKLR